MKFDVFVSFRGIDTRRTFVSHLLLSLFKKKITTYKHEEERLENHPPSSQVLQAIEESKIAIVIISKNYAASSWCLDELAKIMKCKEKRWIEVVTVFYEVDPSDVLKRVDDFGEQCNGDGNLKKVMRWKDALENLINIYRQKYSYWEDEDSYSYTLDRILIHVSDFLKDSSIYYSRLVTQNATNSSRNRKATFGSISGSPVDDLWNWNNRLTGPSLTELDLSADFNSFGDLSFNRNSVGPKKAQDSVIPRKSLLSLLSPTVTKWIGLVSSSLRTIARRFMYREGSNGVKLRHPRSLLDIHNDNYVTGDNLSRVILSNYFISFVGMDRLTKAVYTLLDLESRDSILEIGIFGVKGVGKTTLARCVYEQISPDFQDHHYFNDTTNCSPGVCLLDDIARTSRKEEYESLHEVVKAKLGHRKVLLIVDNISTGRQLENIRNISRWFGPGSRLIFVTSVKYSQLNERLYVVEPLRYDEALQLFSHFAFKREHVPREYYQLSVRAVTITGRIPLALKVFGTFLCDKNINEWQHELRRLEAPQSRWDCVAKVSSYIGDALS